jgi:hypothetical protein
VAGDCDGPQRVIVKPLCVLEQGPRHLATVALLEAVPVMHAQTLEVMRHAENIHGTQQVTVLALSRRLFCFAILSDY